MRRYYNQLRQLATSTTAKDTYILFVGNLVSAFLGFLYTLLVARALTVSDFGVFSAATNLIYILVSVSDLGISTGAVNFIADAHAKGLTTIKEAYMKSSLLIRSGFMTFIALIFIIFAPWLSRSLLATDDKTVSIWVAVVSWIYLLSTVFSFILQAQKKFFKSAMIDIWLNIFRVFLVFLLFLLAGLTLSETFLAFAGACFLATIVGFYFVKTKFLFAPTDKSIHLNLLKFSGWLGVNRVLSTISGRLDVQMLASLSGAIATGFYSISIKLAFFIVVLVGSFSAVLAPRLASYGDKNKEKDYLIKATLATLPMVGVVVAWIIIAKPFILILFGQKYLQSVTTFQALAAAYIPFILTAPPVTAIVYSIKKPSLIGIYSVINLILVFGLNLVFIPKYGQFGPVITIAITNVALAIFSWYIVIKHYWLSK